jgi:Transglycosylase SLT domain
MPDGNYFDKFDAGAASGDLDSDIHDAAQRNGVDPTLYHSLIMHESGGNQYAVSPQGAAGYAQLEPETAASLGVTDIFDRHQNLDAGAKYLRQGLDRYGNRPDLALAYYHGGPDTQQWGPKTAAYSDAVMDAYRAKKAEKPAAGNYFDKFDAKPQGGNYFDKFDPQPAAPGAPSYTEPPVNRIWEGDTGTPLNNRQAVQQLPMAKTEAAAPIASQIPAGTLGDVLSSPKALAADVPQSQGPNPALAAIGQKIKEAWQNSPTILTPQAQGWLDRTGLGGVTRLADIAMAAPNAVFAGGLEAAAQTAGAIGGQKLAGGVRELGEYAMMTGVPELTMAPHPHEGAPEPAPVSTTPTLDAMASEAKAARTPIGPEETGATEEPVPAEQAAVSTLQDISEGKPATETVAPHPAPDNSGAMTNLSDADYTQLMVEREKEEAPVEAPQVELGENMMKTSGEVGDNVAPPEAEPQAETPTEAASPAISARRTTTPFETLPNEPMRLNEYLRRPTVMNAGTIHEQTIPGGVRDPGGDLKAIIGGSKGRPGLINNKAGRSLDDAAQYAFEAGYFPGHSERPSINELLDAMAEDHRGNAQYSHFDQDRADEYRAAVGRNSEVDRLATEHDIPTLGITREQFYDALADRMSVEDQAREITEQEASHDAAYREAERQAKAWAAEHPEEAGAATAGWNAKHFYGNSQARTLEDLEREHEQEALAATQGERQARGEQAGPPGEHPGAVPEGGEPRGGGAGTAGGAGAEGQTTDLLGRPVAEPRAKAQPEPTIHNDQRQITMPGAEPSAIQAQAARDAQGRGALQSDVTQKLADEGLFAPDTSGQGTLYSFPGALFDPEAWRWLAPAVRPLWRAASGALKAAGEVTDSALTSLAPMRGGTVRAQAFAADFANSLRRTMYRFGQVDREIERNFSPNERLAMGRALDAQSVFEQQVRDMLPEEAARARADFDAGGTGLASLNPAQRHTIEMLDALSQDAWLRMQERGMVAADARPIPYYFPRQMVQWSEEEGFSRAGGQGQTGRGLDARGLNLTTAGPMRREYLTPEETEAAARAKLGPGTVLLRDIRSLPQRLAFAHRAIAGVDLMKRIEEVGKDVGTDLVIRGDIPGLLQPGDYFTMSDHPSFRRWTGTGWQAINVSKEFEGPLKAVLTQRSPTWFRAARSIQGAVMAAIMWSPYIHLGVELGRAFTAHPSGFIPEWAPRGTGATGLPLPGGAITLRVLKNGAINRRNLAYMDKAATDGLAPIGQGWHADPVTIADQANVEGRGSFLRALASARDAVANGAGKLGGDTLREIVRHPHQTLLWDQVLNLQVGLYDHLKQEWTPKYGEDVAGTMAAHEANRFAGALPPEHLSRGANMTASMLLFSRSFTLGNLGVMKDMFKGAPPHILSRIEQMAGPDVAKSAQSAMRRKAFGAVAMDIGLFYLGYGLIQSGIQALRQSGQQAYEDWTTKASEALTNAKDNPIDAFGVFPQHWNEPGKTNRIYAGNDSQGRGVYVKLPPGKIGEEFMGWPTNPAAMLVNKSSVFVRPIIESIFNIDALGRRVYNPSPQTLGDYASIAGHVVGHIGAGLGPVSLAQGVGELYDRYISSSDQPSKVDPWVSWLKVLGPATGLGLVSQGFPGGPAAGEIHALTERQRYEVQQALPGIRKKIEAGDTDGAREAMSALQVPPRLQQFYIQQTLNPGPSRGGLRALREAPPRIQQRVEHQMQP